MTWKNKKYYYERTRIINYRRNNLKESKGERLQRLKFCSCSQEICQRLWLYTVYMVTASRKKILTHQMTQKYTDHMILVAQSQYSGAPFPGWLHLLDYFWARTNHEKKRGTICFPIRMEDKLANPCQLQPLHLL